MIWDRNVFRLQRFRADFKVLTCFCLLRRQLEHFWFREYSWGWGRIYLIDDREEKLRAPGHWSGLIASSKPLASPSPCQFESTIKEAWKHKYKSRGWKISSTRKKKKSTNSRHVWTDTILRKIPIFSIHKYTLRCWKNTQKCYRVGKKQSVIF